VPRGQYVKFNASALLRTDTLNRYQAHAIALENGFLSIDEVRDLEDRRPLPEAQTPPRQIGAEA
jgi:phage portal protein BeeE